jgi:hypothetical protein
MHLQKTAIASVYKLDPLWAIIHAPIFGSFAEKGSRR